MESQLFGTSLVMRLSGELDMVAGAEFKRIVDDLLDRRKVRNLFVNLERVTFVDSSFLGALLGRYRRIVHLGGRVGIVRPLPAVRPILEMSGLFRIMAEYGSEPDALSAG
jgi:stage II sporulation protein AA (anti-sigma F factor antagonist)